MATSKVTRADVYAILAQKSGFEVTKEKESAKQLRIVGRSPADRWPFWAPVVLKLLLSSKKPGAKWTCDISKMYFEDDGRIFYSWRLIFQTDVSLLEQYTDIVAVIASAERPSRVEISSMLLPGYKAGTVRGGVDARGRGASAAGTSPLILTRNGPAVR